MPSILGGDGKWDRAAAVADDRRCTECGSRTNTVECLVGLERHEMHRVCGYCVGLVAAKLAEARALLERVAERGDKAFEVVDDIDAWLAANPRAEAKR